MWAELDPSWGLGEKQVLAVLPSYSWPPAFVGLQLLPLCGTWKQNLQISLSCPGILPGSVSGYQAPAPEEIPANADARGNGSRGPWALTIRVRDSDWVPSSDPTLVAEGIGE